jgi:hypothetical protein
MEILLDLLGSAQIFFTKSGIGGGKIEKLLHRQYWLARALFLAHRNPPFETLLFTLSLWPISAGGFGYRNPHPSHPPSAKGPAIRCRHPGKTSIV